MAEPNLDILLIDTHNTYSLGIGDISTYPTGFNIVNPTIEITPPGFPKVNLSFTAKNINVYNSYNLGLCLDDINSKTPIPDGIYTIKYSIHPHYKYVVEKSFIRTDMIQEKFDSAFLKTDLMNCDKEIKDRDERILKEIYFNIQGSISAANSCANKLAMELYNKANRQITDFMDQRCYNC